MASPTKRPSDDETPRAKRVQTGLIPERSYPSLSSASEQSTSSRAPPPTAKQHTTAYLCSSY
ncbi:hypothetical protein BBO_00010 [Beauveria brongniartii RCEF 3172]|uniref:Uncharacterized protein n=1 Tax=Beauveria brongniartii RCEF 3172 TaxID=1081107 RepID=A0A167KTD7_9HYPO|nr:hypothetical protein BBO_00010 [Beauveria brongniartii RCEF 3172]